MKSLQRFDNILALAFEIKGRLLKNNISENTVVSSVYHEVNAEQEAKPSAGIYVADLEKARYAIYFFVDEILMDELLMGDPLIDINPNTQNDTHPPLAWYKHSLQRKFLESDRGGELFYMYFEEILDTLLLTMPIYSSNAEQKLSKAQILAENTSITLTEKFRHVIQSASCLNPKNTESDITSKLYLLATYAQCILFGFRGKFYDSEYDDMFKKLRMNAQSFLTVSKSEKKKPAPTAEQTNTLPPPRNRHNLFSYFFYISCPILLCILWYLYCAETIIQSIAT